MRANLTGTRLAVLALVTMVLYGCASPVSRDITRPPAGDFTVAQVRANVEQFINAPVRWGGTILGLDNDDQESAIEIIARPLRRDGRPEDTDGSPGRFIAVVDGFLDPAIFTEDRNITVYGTIEGETVGRIGRRDYNYPVVRVHDFELWHGINRRAMPPPHFSPYYYDPFYPWGTTYWHGPRFRSGGTSSPPTRPHILRR